jgi:hypothetical protein
VYPRGRHHREVKNLAMSMIVNLGWPLVSTIQHAEVREVITSPFEAC